MAKSTLLDPHFRKPRTRREEFYQHLRSSGMAPIEARSFCRYWRKYNPPGGGRKVMVPVIKEMIANRRAMMDATLIEAEAKGWSLTKANNIYKNRILDVYKGIDRWRTSKGMMGKFVDAPFVTKDVHGRPIPKTINPWALKEYTWQDLPEADRWDSPNSGWTNKPPFSPQFDRKAQQFAKKRLHDEIRFHKAEIKRTGDPTGWHETAMLAKQYELKEGLY